MSNLTLPKFSVLIGMNGVSSDENRRARRMGTVFEAPMLLIAMGVVLLWYLERQQLVTPEFVWVSDMVVWGFFVLESLVLTCLVDNKKRHLLNNWMNLAIIISGLPIILEDTTLAPILRSFRLLLLVALFVNAYSTIKAFLARNNLGITLTICMALMIIVGIFISVIDPAIETPWDGLWWAWVTITTVGYGDVVPVSPAGRITGSVMILVGFGMFSLMTASMSAFLITREEDEVIDREEELLEKLSHISNKLEALERRMEEMQSQQQDAQPKDD
jgi:voltage-gated potassium channel